MEDEHADRVYVPGTNATPPDRDVEPFWAQEELEAPVHGGRPVPHEAPPAIPLPPPPEGGVYRPVDRPGPMAPIPLPHQPPIPHQPLSAAPPPTAPPPATSPSQPWPNLQPQQPAGDGAPDPSTDRAAPFAFPAAPVSGPAESATPAAGVSAPGPAHAAATPAYPAAADSPSGDPDATGSYSTGDSPWSQPPHRPAQEASPAAPISPAAPPRATASVPGATRPGYYSTVTPREASEDTAGEAHNGAIYRPGAHAAPTADPDPASAAGPASGPSQSSGPRQPLGPSPTHGPGPGPGPTSGPSQAPAPRQTLGPSPAHGPVPGPGPASDPSQASGPRQTHGPSPTHGPGPGPTSDPNQAPGPRQTHGPSPAHGPVPHAVHGTAQVPHQAAPHPAPPHPAPPQAPYGGPPAGPYPPAVDHRAVPQHPQLQQPDASAPQQPHPGPGAVDPFQDLAWVSDGTPTAEEFARRRMAKPAEPTATMGARALLRKGTMGLVKLAPGRHEQEYKQDVEMVRRNFGGLRQVTVVNPKGGAGKTVAVLLLAMTFGQKRGGYVLAWDNNETQGTLGMRAQQDFHARTVRDMMRDLHLFRGAHGRVGDLSQYVRAQGEGMFDVLASDESATAGEMLTASAFGEIREIVSRFYKLIFVDTGNNVRAQNWQAAMDATDQLVITMSARNDSAETAARMLDHLEQSGRQRLVRQAVSIVSMPPTRKDIDLPAIQRHFAARTRAVLLAPYEKLIDSGEPLRYGQLSANTKDAWLKIAAAVAEGL